MPGLPDAPLQPTGAVGPARPVHSDLPESAPSTGSPTPRPAPINANTTAAVTGGALRAAYAQFVINPDTHDVVVRIRDAKTDALINEIPAPEVEELANFLRDYTDALARRAAKSHPAS